MKQNQPNPAPTAGTALNPLAFMYGTMPVFHVRKDSTDSSSRVTNYWYKIGEDSEETDVRNLANWQEPIYDSMAPIGSYAAIIMAEARRVIGLHIDDLPPATPANPAPAPNPVETLLAFIEANASDEVFEKAQELEALLSAQSHSYKSEAEEWQQKLADLKEELTDGYALSQYAKELKPGQLTDFVSQMLDEYDFRAAIEEDMKPQLFQAGTTYLPIEETADHMDAIAAPALAELIQKMGIAEALRLLQSIC